MTGAVSEDLTQEALVRTSTAFNLVFSDSCATIRATEGLANSHARNLPDDILPTPDDMFDSH